VNFHNITSISLNILVLSCLAYGCSTIKNTGSQEIITIDQRSVTTEEFLYVFEKNNLNQNLEVVTEDDVRDYLDLFINFKLKVLEAEAQGLHQDPDFISELEGYRKQLAQPYLTETQFMDSLVKVTYDRLGEEVNASHLLIRVAEDANPADTLVAYRKIEEIRAKVDAGGDFNSLAQQFSEDPSASQNEGQLGYFSAMQMVYDFENAAYGLNINEVSQPVRTRFGYHLIKVHDKRASHGKIQVAHILIRANPAIPAQDSLAAAEKAFEIYRLAKKGEDWDLLCRQFSEDTSTKLKGGSLPWFKTGDLSNIPAFEKAAFALVDVNEISQPVKTPYGWHIIRLENRLGLEPFEELEPRIRANLTRNSRGDLNKQALVKRLKAENNFQEMPQALDIALTHATDSLLQGIWQSDPAWNDQANTLFLINEMSVTLGDFYQYLETNQPFQKGSSAAQKMTGAYSRFSEERLIRYEEQNLSTKYPEYRLLSQEYRDGLLLFQLMEDKVWNKAVEDSAGLNSFFAQHRQLYQWGPRVQATIFNAADQRTLDQVVKFLNEGSMEYLKYDFSGSELSLNKAQIKILDNIARQLKQGSKRYLVLEYPDDAQSKKVRDLLMTHLTNYKIADRVKENNSGNYQGFIAYVASRSPQDLAAKLNEKQPLTLQIENGRFQKGDNPLVDEVPWQPGQRVVEKDGRFILVNIEQVLPAGNQELSEIKGQVISDYQVELEKLWLDELKNKYQVTINEKAVKNVYEMYEK